MVNDDLLQQFKTTLAENNKQLRQEIREDNKAAIKAEVDPLHERLDAQRQQINTVEKNLSEQIARQEEQIANVKAELSEQISNQSHEVADVLAKAVIPDIDRHEAQIAELQKAVGLRPKQ
jgi:uncharacterized protein (DUF342 family)